MIELQNFADKKEQKNSKSQKSSALVLGNANTNLAIEDGEELDQIINFFEIYGKVKEDKIEEQIIDLTTTDNNKE